MEQDMIYALYTFGQDIINMNPFKWLCLKHI